MNMHFSSAKYITHISILVRVSLFYTTKKLNKLKHQRENAKSLHFVFSYSWLLSLVQEINVK